MFSISRVYYNRINENRLTDDNDGDDDDSIFDESKSKSERSIKESESMLNNYEETNVLDSKVPEGPQTESKVKGLLQDGKNHRIINKYSYAYCNT